jgi:hypothetical protein
MLYGEAKLNIKSTGRSPWEDRLRASQVHISNEPLRLKISEI